MIITGEVRWALQYRLTIPLILHGSVESSKVAYQKRTHNKGHLSSLFHVSLRKWEKTFTWTRFLAKLSEIFRNMESVKCQAKEMDGGNKESVSSNQTCKKIWKTKLG